MRDTLNFQNRVLIRCSLKQLHFFGSTDELKIHNITVITYNYLNC